jgi:hypothetical protein
MAPRSLMLYSAREIYFHQGKCKQLANLSRITREARHGPQSFNLYGKNAFIPGMQRTGSGARAAGPDHSWCENYILELKECRPA